jgi:hypothetical protein
MSFFRILEISWFMVSSTGRYLELSSRSAKVRFVALAVIMSNYSTGSFTPRKIQQYIKLSAISGRKFTLHFIPDLTELT